MDLFITSEIWRIVQICAIIIFCLGYAYIGIDMKLWEKFGKPGKYKDSSVVCKIGRPILIVSFALMVIGGFIPA
ncbi:MAG: hypothetical protein LBU36_02730 [Clostridiales bacterium]|jgi:hypothetical protein|nr:hypothetical protein [Clostridiales bacterium]